MYSHFFYKTWEVTSIATQQLIDIIIKAQDKASAVAEKVDSQVKKLGNSTSLLGRIPGFNTLSKKLSGFGSTIKGKVTPYIDSARNKLQQLSNGAKGFGAVLGPLKSALSMTAGMIGYDLVNSLVQSARASINAASQLDYFGKRLNMTASETTKFRGEIDSLQKEFRKVDMTAVGATAEELAVKYNLPKESLADLTRMTAVMSSTFVKEGRTQEDSILAVSDALDGQFKRLQEIGISKEMLMQNGWNGDLQDQKGLIDALNKSMQQMGYEQTAKDITNLDEAWNALSIAGGQLLQKVLVPITPAIIQVINALLQVADALGPMITGFINFVANMPDWAKFAGLAGIFVVALQLISVWITGTLVPALAAAALAALDFAAALLANPLTWVALALAAVAFAIYEVGKAFGWWTDVQSMLAAVWAGIQRLWSAFINHPDVQALIAALGQAWNELSSAIGGVINWVSQFFTVSNSGEFDVVRAIIDGVTQAWALLSVPIKMVIDLFSKLFSIGQQVASGQMDMMTAIIQIWNALQTFFGVILTFIGNLILQWAGQIWNYAVTAATNFVNGIINRVKQLPGKFLTWLLKTYSNVVFQFTKMVTTAKMKALALVTGAINYIKTLPGKAYTQLIAVVGKITSAGSQWISKAKEKAKAVVDGAYNTLSSLPGRVGSAVKGVTDKIVKPFKDAYDKAKKLWQDITSLGGLTGGAAGFDYEGMLEELLQQKGLDVANDITENLDVNVKQELEIVVDLKNVPEGMDETLLREILKEAITEKSVIEALVNSTYFQKLDKKVKERILSKYNRSQGL